jgi:Protein kinase domain/Calx-beta domain
MFDPTQTQPLSWRMHQGKPTPAEEVPVEPPNRQEPSFDGALPDRLSERGYRLRARLGSGRVGPIYEAQDELSRSSGSQHFVAIQLIDERIASLPGFDAEFERGAAALKAVSHPNIVKLLEYGRDHDRYYLVNELLESASLRFVLNDAARLPAAESTAVLRAVGDALQYLHAKSMVHGNLRPENVLVTFGYEVKLLDIVPSGWLVNPTDALGVPARAPDKRDDVFGLACLAYEMLSGRHPYNGNTAQEAHRAGLEAERIEGLRDREWRALAEALAVHRDDRTPSVAQFLDEFGVAGDQRLRAVVEAVGETEVAYHSPAPQVPRPVIAERDDFGRPERRGYLGSLVLLLVVAGLGAAAWYYQEPLGVFATDLMSEVEARMSADASRGDRTAEPVATASESVDAPLTEAPAVTDTAPATVLAPGATAPPETEPVQPGQASSGTAAQAEQSDPAPAAGERTSAETPIPEPAQAPLEIPTAARVAAPAAAPYATPGVARFAFQQSVASVREGDVAARIVIRRSGSMAGTAEVSWWTSGGTAIADGDYADLGARVERFAPGEASRTVYVPITNDAIAEPAKSFTVLLGREGASAGELRVDIIDDD